MAAIHCILQVKNVHLLKALLLQCNKSSLSLFGITYNVDVDTEPKGSVIRYTA